MLQTAMVTQTLVSLKGSTPLVT